MRTHLFLSHKIVLQIFSLTSPTDCLVGLRHKAVYKVSYVYFSWLPQALCFEYHANRIILI